jgi:glucose/arabinose dehydrogenase
MPRRLLLLALFLPLAAAAQDIALTRITGGLASPLGIVSAGDSRLFIVQQRGTIVIWDGTRILPTPFLDIGGLVSSSGNERGLLGLAFHPQYASNGLFFVYYTAAGSGDVTIARYSVLASNRDRADVASGAVLLTISHSEFANHNGGQLQFGPDGYLYAGVGDGGSAGDPHNHGQDLGQLLGKILRIDVDHPPYAIPPTNPFASHPGARGEIWAYGLRNPWRFSFDRDTADLWIADVGQDKYEEVDLQPATSGGGEDYGWRLMEGMHCFNPSTNCPTAGLTLPILEYTHGFGCSITGGYRYRGARFPRLRGSYFYGDYCSGRIWGAAQANGAWTSRVMLSTSLAISTFGEDANGELYLADIDGGVLYQVVDPAPPAKRRAAGR